LLLYVSYFFFSVDQIAKNILAAKVNEARKLDGEKKRIVKATTDALTTANQQLQETEKTIETAFLLIVALCFVFLLLCLLCLVLFVLFVRCLVLFCFLLLLWLLGFLIGLLFVLLLLGVGLRSFALVVFVVCLWFVVVCFVGLV
jgi:hypothetical protein